MYQWIGAISPKYLKVPNLGLFVQLEVINLAKDLSYDYLLTIAATEIGQKRMMGVGFEKLAET